MSAVPTVTGANFTALHYGPYAALDQYGYYSKKRGVEVTGKRFVKAELGTTGTEISLTRLKPNESVGFFHSHRLNEEVFLVISGEGEFQVDDEVFPIREGSVIRVAQAGDRCLRNTSAGEPLCYICIQAKAGSLEAYSGDDGIISTRRARWEQQAELTTAAE